MVTITTTSPTARIFDSGGYSLGGGISSSGSVSGGSGSDSVEYVRDDKGVVVQVIPKDVKQYPSDIKAWERSRSEGVPYTGKWSSRTSSVSAVYTGGVSTKGGGTLISGTHSQVLPYSSGVTETTTKDYGYRGEGLSRSEVRAGSVSSVPVSRGLYQKYADDFNTARVSTILGTEFSWYGRRPEEVRGVKERLESTAFSSRGVVSSGFMPYFGVEGVSLSSPYVFGKEQFRIGEMFSKPPMLGLYPLEYQIKPPVSKGERVLSDTIRAGADLKLSYSESMLKTYSLGVFKGFSPVVRDDVRDFFVRVDDYGVGLGRGVYNVPKGIFKGYKLVGEYYADVVMNKPFIEGVNYRAFKSPVVGKALVTTGSYAIAGGLGAVLGSGFSTAKSGVGFLVGVGKISPFVASVGVKGVSVGLMGLYGYSVARNIPFEGGGEAVGEYLANEGVKFGFVHSGFKFGGERFYSFDRVGVIGKSGEVFSGYDVWRGFGWENQANPVGRFGSKVLFGKSRDFAGVERLVGNRWLRVSPSGFSDLPFKVPVGKFVNVRGGVPNLSPYGGVGGLFPKGASFPVTTGIQAKILMGNIPSVSVGGVLYGTQGTGKLVYPKAGADVIRDWLRVGADLRLVRGRVKGVDVRTSSLSDFGSRFTNVWVMSERGTLYGSSSTQYFLDSDLKVLRGKLAGDKDVQLRYTLDRVDVSGRGWFGRFVGNVQNKFFIDKNVARTEVKVKALAELLRSSGGLVGDSSGGVKTNLPSSWLVETKPSFKWVVQGGDFVKVKVSAKQSVYRHAIDIHGKSGSGSYGFGDRWAGLSLSYKPVVVEGLRVQSLGENVVRKISSVATLRQSSKGELFFAPEAHRGKDVVDAFIYSTQAVRDSGRLGVGKVIGRLKLRYGDEFFSGLRDSGSPVPVSSVSSFIPLKVESPSRSPSRSSSVSVSRGISSSRGYSLSPSLSPSRSSSVSGLSSSVSVSRSISGGSPSPSPSISPSISPSPSPPPSIPPSGGYLPRGLGWGGGSKKLLGKPFFNPKYVGSVEAGVFGIKSKGLPSKFVISSGVKLRPVVRISNKLIGGL